MFTSVKPALQHMTILTTQTFVKTIIEDAQHIIVYYLIPADYEEEAGSGCCCTVVDRLLEPEGRLVVEEVGRPGAEDRLEEAEVEDSQIGRLPGEETIVHTSLR